jgi:hypothetical protein
LNAKVARPGARVARIYKAQARAARPWLCPSDIMDGNTTATCAPAALEASYMAMAQQLRPACALLLAWIPTYLSVEGRCLPYGSDGLDIAASSVLGRALLFFNSSATTEFHVPLGGPDRRLGYGCQHFPGFPRGNAAINFNQPFSDSRCPQIKVLQNPFRRPLIWNPAAVATMGVLDGLPNFFADLALLCRMLVVYPYSMTSHPRYFAIFVPVICIKIIRIVSMIVTVSLALHHPAHVGSFAWTNTNRIWAIVNITAAAVDNGYVHDPLGGASCTHPC